MDYFPVSDHALSFHKSTTQSKLNLSLRLFLDKLQASNIVLSVLVQERETNLLFVFFKQKNSRLEPNLK